MHKALKNAQRIASLSSEIMYFNSLNIKLVALFIARTPLEFIF